MTRQVSTPRSGMWWVIKRIKESKDVGLEGRGRASKKQERLCKQNDHDHYRADYGAVSWARRASKSEACPKNRNVHSERGNVDGASWHSWHTLIDFLGQVTVKE